MTDSACRLYLITPPELEPVAFADTLKRALEAGDVACLQLRLKAKTEKTSDPDRLRRATEVLMPIAHAHDVAFLINDDVTVAADMGADGVHIGQSDMPYADARARLGKDKIIGVTCHNSRHLAMVAGEAGADYVAFGAFHPTDTKQADTRADPELLTWWSQLFEVPCVAIGGITTENARPLIEAGADFLAASSGIWGYADGPAAAVRAFNLLLKEGAAPK